MSLPRYESYKDSCVEWLGEVPDHWDIMSLKRICDVRDGTHDTPTFVDETEQTFPLVTSKDIVNGLLNFTDTKHISEADYISIAKRSEVVHGDILMPMIGSIGGAVIVNSDKNFAIKNIALFKQGSAFTSFWLMHLLNSKLAIIQFELERSGGVQGFISLGTLRNLRFPIPNTTEQLKIANFLDQETAKIDNLIAEQQQLIKLLKEKRQAVISHAVTKGLNPDVPMKDSGVEWLGEVPEHWDVKRLKYKFRLLTEKSVQSENTIALENIESWTGRFIYTESLFEGSGVNFDNGDILFGKLRPYLAKVFHCENEGEAIGDFFVLRPSKDTNSQFAQYQILNSDFIAIVDSSTYGTKMPRVNWEFFSNMVISSPPIDEQQQINHFLKVEISKFENLDQEAKSIINLLKERRSALISSAVTGKIDVRNFVPSQPNVEAVV